MAKKVKTIEYSGELKAGKRLVIRNEHYDVVSKTQVRSLTTGETLKVVKPKAEKTD